MAVAVSAEPPTLGLGVTFHVQDSGAFVWVVVRAETHRNLGGLTAMLHANAAECPDVTPYPEVWVGRTVHLDHTRQHRLVVWQIGFAEMWDGTERQRGLDVALCDESIYALREAEERLRIKQLRELGELS